MIEEVTVYRFVDDDLSVEYWPKTREFHLEYGRDNYIVLHHETAKELAELFIRLGQEQHDD